jgi:hypothetical protein
MTSDCTIRALALHAALTTVAERYAFRVAEYGRKHVEQDEAWG